MSLRRINKLKSCADKGFIMNMRKIFIVFRKEIIDTLRDKKTIMVMVLLPILIYPALFITISQIFTVGTQKLETEESIVHLTIHIPVQLVNRIEQEEKIIIVNEVNYLEALKEKKIHAILEYKEEKQRGNFIVYFDGAVDRSRLARNRMEAILTDYKRFTQEQLLEQQMIDVVLLDPFFIQYENTASASRMGGVFLGSIIPMILIVTMVLGAMYPAIDLTAGEKERGTLETILTLPVKRLELLFGKYFTVVATALLTGILNLLSMILVYTSGLIQTNQLSGEVDFSVTFKGILFLFLSIIPFALLISAVILSVCLFARSFKEAQNYVTPVYLMIMFPSFVAFSPGIELTGLLAMVPVVNLTLLFKEIFLNNFQTDLIFLVFISNSFLAILCISLVSKLFHAESILFTEGNVWQLTLKRSEIKPSNRFEVSTSLMIFSIIMLFLFYLGSYLQMRYRVMGVFLTEWILIFIPVICAIWFFKVDLKQTLNLSRFSVSGFIGSIIFIFGALIVTTVIGHFQIKIFPESVEVSESIEKLLNINTQNLHPFWGYLVFALSPAICEEVLFRGIILSSLKDKISPSLCIMIVGFLFGVFHMHIFRMFPTALLGIALTFIVYHTGSIYLSMIAHFFNNGFALTLVNFPSIRKSFGWLAGEEEISVVYPFIGIGCLVLGLGFLFLPKILSRKK